LTVPETDFPEFERRVPGLTTPWHVYDFQIERRIAEWESTRVRVRIASDWAAERLGAEGLLELETVLTARSEFRR
jgi:hypothetical protein